MKTHKYQVNDRVIFRHQAVGSMSGRITSLTWYPVKVHQKPRATYTALGDDGVVYPLLGIDKESMVGNICTKSTKAGRLLLNQHEIDTEDDKPTVCPFISYNLKDLQEKCKAANIPYYGSKKDLIRRLKRQS